MKRFSSLLVSFALFAATAAAQDSQWIAFESLDPNTQIIVEQNSTGPIQGVFERATADTLFVRVDGNTMSVPRPDIQLVRTPPRTGGRAKAGAGWGALSGGGVGVFLGLLAHSSEMEQRKEFPFRYSDSDPPMNVWAFMGGIGGFMGGVGAGIGALIGSRIKWERGGETIYDGAGTVGLRISPIVTGQERGVRVEFSFD